jgi:hypothetical protein
MKIRIGNYTISITCEKSATSQESRIIEEALFYGFNQRNKLMAVKTIKVNYDITLREAKEIFDEIVMYQDGFGYKYFMDFHKAKKHLKKELKKYVLLSKESKS